MWTAAFKIFGLELTSVISLSNSALIVPSIRKKWLFCKSETVLDSFFSPFLSTKISRYFGIAWKTETNSRVVVHKKSRRVTHKSWSATKRSSAFKRRQEVTRKNNVKQQLEMCKRTVCSIFYCWLPEAAQLAASLWTFWVIQKRENCKWSTVQRRNTEQEWLSQIGKEGSWASCYHTNPWVLIIPCFLKTLSLLFFLETLSHTLLLHASFH